MGWCGACVVELELCVEEKKIWGEKNLVDFGGVVCGVCGVWCGVWVWCAT